MKDTDGPDDDLWFYFCSDYLVGTIQKTWDLIESNQNINFISLRKSDSHPMVTSNVSWENMVLLVEQYGIGTFDAMILNLFQLSKLNLLITADSDLAYSASKLNLNEKHVFVPKNLL